MDHREALAGRMLVARRAKKIARSTGQKVRMCGRFMRGLLAPLKSVACGTRGWSARLRRETAGSGNTGMRSSPFGLNVARAVHRTLETCINAASPVPEARTSDRIAAELLRAVERELGWSPVEAETPVACRKRGIGTCADAVFVDERTGAPCIVDWKVGFGGGFLAESATLRFAPTGGAMSTCKYYMCQLACTMLLFEKTYNVRMCAAQGCIVRGDIAGHIEILPMDAEIFAARRKILDQVARARK